MEMNSDERISKFISSQQMESFEIQKRIINLGKALIDELKLDPGVDTFSRWIVHYVAEQITIAESATGDEKIAAERRCFETILKLWHHRSTLPNGHRPLEKFDPIFHALARLDPDNPNPYFFSSSDAHSSETGYANTEVDEVRLWLDIAHGIDRGARVLLEHVFYQAALSAIDTKTIICLKNAIDIPPDDDISIINQLAQADVENEEDMSEKRQQIKRERLQSRIKKLDAFIDLSKALRTSFINDLENMAKDKTSSTSAG